MGATPAIDLSQPLAVLLREGTKQAHTEAETSEGAKMLLGGKLPKDEYVRFLMMLWYVYNAIERALDKHATHPTLEPTYNPTLLARSALLSADISYLLSVPSSESGEEWKAHPMHQALVTPALPEALQTYVDRLDALADAPDPSPLLAHSYVRYLGDLSGGQSIKRTISKAYGLGGGVGAGAGVGDDDLGVSFYVFKELRSAQSASIGEMKKIKDWFRDGMNVAGESCESPEAKLAIVEEASRAFRLNMGIFSAIDTTDVPNQSSSSSAMSQSKRRQVGRSGAHDEPEPAVLVSEKSYTDSTFPIASVMAVITAVCLAHFLLVVGGFTGNRGYEKLLAVERWLSETYFQVTGSSGSD